MIRIATAQSHVTQDVRANGREVRAAMVQAAAAGGRLVHFPETALSGYPLLQDGESGCDWGAIGQELEATAAEAGRLGLWVVLGASHAVPGRARPLNSLHVISDRGRLVGRYDKRMCSNTELTRWFTPGRAPVMFEVDGFRFGCAICIEVVFPQIFAEYEAMQADCVLLSAFSQDRVHGVMAQAHAATTCMWVSVSTPVCCSAGLSAALFGPDGYPMGVARAGVPGLLLHELDRDASRYQVALRHARPWRARARSGEIYRAAEGGGAPPGPLLRGQAKRVAAVVEAPAVAGAALAAATR